VEVLHQDEALVAVNKPPGRIVVPGRGAAAKERTLKEEIADRLGRPVYVVHRLDRDTSGVLLFALGPETHRALSLAFERRDTAKRYWALCAGELVGQGEIARALVPVRGGRSRAARPGEAGKPSATAWRVLERFAARAGVRPCPGFTWVELRPTTGRLHQIRVHAALLGFPLAVDPAYGGAAVVTAGELDPRWQGAEGARPVVARVPLHAADLRLRHPLTQRWLRLEAPLPADLEEALALLRHRGR